MSNERKLFKIETLIVDILLQIFYLTNVRIRGSYYNPYFSFSDILTFLEYGKYHPLRFHKSKEIIKIEGHRYISVSGLYNLLLSSNKVGSKSLKTELYRSIKAFTQTNIETPPKSIIC
ncbi:putative Bro-N domain-containing protein 2 [Diachasmimorpha longicaudata entomopoxvirus]|uniref:Putative Bro-N domain-containing protein 2 n=1 Tax=Diachasmimorpha longicaudata entomopoxvirus TaxID=109981 RepID=A0A7R5WJ18_9POXV|nr:putative Bro-N domain-containing protein 2 [Diachasmimorpha longicaudata entomopoxvirus]AKS26303.1 putative Bro-N domain-containing protein 2 [Diachasmimorpha longicaudata entomopoxvirus]